MQIYTWLTWFGSGFFYDGVLLFVNVKVVVDVYKMELLVEQEEFFLCA